MAKTLPFRTERFDVVLSLYVLHHAQGYRAALAEMARVLKPGYTTDLNGTSREFRNSQGALAIVFVLALLFIFLVLSAQFESFVDPLVIDPARLAPLALFAVEAITNAQKHAFTKRGGVLTVRFDVRGDEAELTISDDGKASDDSLVASGVGRTLMTAFARQLRGRAELIRNPKGGVTARLVFPTPSADAQPAAAQGNQAAA